MKVLLLNAGSSSLKCTLAESDGERIIASGTAEWAGHSARYTYSSSSKSTASDQVPWRDHAPAVHRFIHDLVHATPKAVSDLSQINAVGHRIVHGGDFSKSVVITKEVRDKITALCELAPLHNPPSLATLSAAQEALADVKHIAVFDTAFHSTLSPAAFTYPLPNQWTTGWRIRRYGFHGLSHAYCARRTAEMLGQPTGDLRTVICHLGHGCSASAVRGQRCVDTSMGFTPLDGLMMASRCGSIDPGIVLHVQQRHGLTPAQIETALNRESGLLGISGVSADMREVTAAAASGNTQAQLALEVFTHRIRQTIGALAATLGGIDALVFSAGIGEHAPSIRKAVCQGLEFLGIHLDADANAKCVTDADVASPGSRVRILVIKTREDLTMLREVTGVMK